MQNLSDLQSVSLDLLTGYSWSPKYAQTIFEILLGFSEFVLLRNFEKIFPLDFNDFHHD